MVWEWVEVERGSVIERLSIIIGEKDGWDEGGMNFDKLFDDSEMGDNVSCSKKR